MNITFLVERPTQFDAPFFRFVAKQVKKQEEHQFHVVFTGSQIDDPVFDPELGMLVSWGFDLREGYEPEGRPSRERLTELLQPGICDLLITNGYRQPIHKEAVRIARKAGVATALRLDSIRKGSALRMLARPVLFAVYLKRSYDLFLGTGNLTLEYLMKTLGVPEWRTGLFPYTVDVEAFRSASDLTPEKRAAVRDCLGVPADARVVLSLAKFSRREAPWDLLRAATQREREDVWLVLVGAGLYRRELEDFAKDQGLTRVRFPGYVPYPKLPALYAAADLFVHPVREEFWGVSVQEALACGLPVIASSEVGAGKDLIEHGGNGFVYTYGNAKQLAGLIDDALALPPEQVQERSREILARWDYAASWRHLLDAASRVARRP